MKIEKLAKSKVKLEIPVSKEDFELALDYAFEVVKKDVEIKGFRKGHVPRNIFENKFGVEALFEEALNKVISEKYYKAVVDNNIKVIAHPKIDLPKDDIKRGVDFSFTATVAVKPEIELGEYKNLKANKIDLTVTDEYINEKISELVKSKATLKTKESNVVELNDTVIFDFKGFIDDLEFAGGSAENYSLEIGSNQFIPGFEEQMIGLKVGDEKEINVRFPDDYHAEEYKGKPAVFKIKIHEVKTLENIEVTDELVKELKIDNVNTVEEYKNYLKEKRVKELELDGKNKIMEELLNKIVKSSKFEVPEEMYENERESLRDKQERQAKQYGLDLKTFIQLTGRKEEEFEMQLAKEAKNKVNYDLIIEAIVDKENFEVSDEDVEKRYEEFSKMYNQDVESIKNQISFDNIKFDIKYQKALDLIIDSAILE